MSQKITNFSKFRSSANRVFDIIEGAVKEIGEKLRLGDFDVDADSIIRGEEGLLAIVEKNGKFYLITQVILHIRESFRKIWALPEPEELFDSDFFVKEFHKYHFKNCRTLQEMFANSRGDRYKLSSRKDGRFRYTIRIKGFKKKIDRGEQRLHVCRNCLQIFNSKYKKTKSVKNFSPKDFFEIADSSQWLKDEGFQQDTQDGSEGVYSSDHKKIADKVKKNNNYKCEDCGINLFHHSYKKYLHCHHANADRSDNRIINLRCLCIKCHAKQYNHSHMKTLPDYKEFLRIRPQIEKENLGQSEL